MSAYPQRIEPGRPSRRVEPKLVKNEPGIYDSKTDEEVLELMYRSPWNVMALLPDIGRVCNGTAEETILLAIHLRSKGGPRGKGEKAPQYSPVLSVKTLAKMTRFSRQTVRQCVAALTDRELIFHLGEDGSDYWRMALDYDAIKAAPRAFVAREGAFTRKPVQSERVAADPDPVEEKGDRKAKAIEDKGTYEAPRATAIARPSAAPQPLPPETATVVAEPEENSRVELINSSPYPLDITRTVTRGNIQIYLTSPGSMGEPPAGTRSQPEPSALAGAGRVKESTSNGSSTVAPPWHAKLREILIGPAGKPELGLSVRTGLHPDMFQRIAIHLTEELLPQFEEEAKDAKGIRKWTGIEGIARQVAARGVVKSAGASGESDGAREYRERQERIKPK